MSGPGISVVVPTYQREAKLCVCLKALAAQTLDRGEFEVIVVDDGGETDLSRLIADWRLELPVRVLRQANAGPAAARNRGAAQARGRWLAFTDDDCVPSRDWLAGLRAAFELQPDALLGGETRNLLEQNPYSAASQLIQDLVYRYYNADPRSARFFASNNLAVPKAGYVAIGGFNEGFRTAEDRDFCDRWLNSGRRMIFTPGARVGHAHDLQLYSYCRQHTAYGRGARRYQVAHRSRAAASSIEPAFYAELMRRLPRALAGVRAPWRVAWLMVVWQVANATGWLMEALRRRHV